jgi:hypothetical protein
MGNPDNAIVLYTVLIVIAFMMSKRFAGPREVLLSGGSKLKAAK